MKQHHFYYQPSPIFSTIDWCWTFVVLLTGIIFWLEVTHVQWITITFFIAFFIIAGLEFLNRCLIIAGSTIIIKNMFGRQWRRFNIDHNSDRVSFSKYTMTIEKNGKKYQYSLFPRDLKKINQIIKAVNR
ncbi:EbsA family protein [uncultured bacterium]|nr:EbsA family protein [uncultured bacterium]